MSAAMNTTITSFQQVLGGADKINTRKKFARSLTKVRERRKVRKDVQSGSIGKKWLLVTQR
jgi:hypothetical protein